MKKRTVLFIAALVTIVTVATLLIAQGSNRPPVNRAGVMPTAKELKIATATAPVLGSAIPFAIPNMPNPGPQDFAEFSWQSFVALMWPAAIGHDGLPIRGQPSTGTISDPGVRVWETWKADWELFGADPNAPAQPNPSAWSSYDVSGVESPCDNPPLSAGPSMKVLEMISKMDDIVPAVNQAKSGPLIDQNMNFVRYEIRLNQKEYETIVSKQWYIADNQPLPSLTLPATSGTTYGAIEIKAAWRIMQMDGARRDDLTRYYTQQALVLDVDGTGRITCQQKTIGLVGFHIAHKLASHPEWIWSTFEQEDNVPEGAPRPGQNYSFNNGTGTPATIDGFEWPPGDTSGHHLAPPPIKSVADFVRLKASQPVQVTRYTPIPSFADALNQKYQPALAGTVWAHYKLTTAQWPTIQNGQNFQYNGTYPQGADSPFPNDHVANTSAETYFQNNGVGQFGTSCMECHYKIASVDFSWTLADEAWLGTTGNMKLATAVLSDSTKIRDSSLASLSLSKAVEKKWNPAAQPPKK